MFDDELEAALGSPKLLGRLIIDNHTEEKARGCRKLVLAAAWADAHPPDEDAARRYRAGSRGRRGAAARDFDGGVEGVLRLGGAGAPLIAETCPAEFGLFHQLGVGSARLLIADALDLRHRLPRLWARVRAEQVHAWKARLVAARTRWLTQAGCGEVDRLLADRLELVSWGRFENILDATMLQVDPTVYYARIEEAKARRDVRAGEADQGLRTLIARATSGDVAVCLAMVNRIADVLADEGDEDPANVRRSKAIGILANPAAALDLLTRHANQPDTRQDPWDYEPDPDGANPWDQPPPAGWATPQNGHYHQPDPADPDYVNSQQPPDDTDQPEEPEPYTEQGTGPRWDGAGADDRTRPAAADTREPREQPYAGEADRHDAGIDDRTATAAGGTRDASAEPRDGGTEDTANREPGRDRVAGLEDGGVPAAGVEDDGAQAACRVAAGSDATPQAGTVEPAHEPAHEPAGGGQSGGGGQHRVPVLGNGGQLALRPVTRAERNASRPRVLITFHLSDLTVRNGHGIVRTDAGAITHDQLRWFLTDTDANITILPVLNPADVAAVDSYEIPLALRRAVDVRNPQTVFPFGAGNSKTDSDHSRAYRPNGPPGQTSPGNLGPLARPEHRAKTVGGWQTRQPEPGTYLWRSPTGCIALTTNQGTLMLGDTPYARQVWADAAPAA